MFDLRRTTQTIAVLSAGIIMLLAERSDAQSPIDISVAGGADAQRIVVIPQSDSREVILSLQGTLSWSSSQGSSQGWLRYRWGQLDTSGKFLAAGSEAPDRIQLGSSDSGFTGLAVDRSIVLLSAQPSASPTKDLVIAIRIEECGFDPPNPSAQARCMFSGAVKTQQVR